MVHINLIGKAKAYQKRCSSSFPVNVLKNNIAVNLLRTFVATSEPLLQSPVQCCCISIYQFHILFYSVFVSCSWFFESTVFIYFFHQNVLKTSSWALHSCPRHSRRLLYYKESRAYHVV